ncbi:farnesol dehydrogenase-like [Musca autumnalis]|uniref:farnesol dehydrogenase-like n=1 Tax=Musca autumnalis TaxID=221902 RepID=UPI003CF75B7D
MERWQNKVAVVTGASSGIGVAIAKDFVKAGLQVIGLARRKDLIENIRNDLPADKRSHLTAMYCDVCNIESVNQVFDKIIKEFDSFKYQCHGYCGMHPTRIQINFNGHIINVNSIAGHAVLPGIPQLLPTTNIYSPTKHAVTAMTEIYRQELRELRSKIKISSISPGFVDTDIVFDGLRKALDECMLRPEDVSNAVMFMISTPPHVQIHDMIIKHMGEIVQ